MMKPTTEPCQLPSQPDVNLRDDKSMLNLVKFIQQHRIVDMERYQIKRFINCSTTHEYMLKCICGAPQVGKTQQSTKLLFETGTQTMLLLDTVSKPNMGCTLRCSLNKSRSHNVGGVGGFTLSKDKKNIGYVSQKLWNQEDLMMIRHYPLKKKKNLAVLSLMPLYQPNKKLYVCTNIFSLIALIVPSHMLMHRWRALRVWPT